MTHIFRNDKKQIQKWKAEAFRAAEHLKKQNHTLPLISVGFVFDDGVMKVTLETDKIKTLPVGELANQIFEAVLATAQTQNTKGNA